MSRTLTVAINRNAVHAIEPTVTTFEADENFVIELDNAGQATHVHLHLDDELARVATLQNGNNHFVEADSTTTVPVTVDESPRPVSGRLKIVTGYGAETRYVEISVVEPTEPERSVQVDDRLSVKQPEPPKPTDRVVSGTTAVLALAIFAILIAIAALLIVESTAVMVGVGVVIFAVGIALYLLFW